ncbi:MAG: prolipoprotein diacylglyceryl transferase [Anaerolineales bacterium]|nr:prolipoprotein diacylglyceryl transferase [Anaerolineales bacterium]
MLPILVQAGPVTVSTFSVLVSLGVAAGLAWLYWRAPAPHKAAWLDLGLAATAGGLAGARLLYVAVNAGYYAGHPLEALMVWQGGLAWPGAALGALLGAAGLARRRGLALRPVLDGLALPILLLSALTWGGCLAAGCAYGAEVAPGELPAGLAVTAPDLYGVSAPRWPTQTAGLLWSLAALAVLYANRRQRWPAGAQGWYALSLAALGAFLISFVRGDPMPMAAGFRLDGLGSGLALLAATLAWAFLLRTAPPAVPPA